MRSFLSYFLVVLHVLIYVWYYSKPIEWSTLNPSIARITFYSIPFALIGVNIIMSTFSCTRIQQEILRMHGTLMVVFGAIYTLQCLGVVNLKRSSVVCLLTTVLILFIFVLFNVRIHRLHRK